MNVTYSILYDFYYNPLKISPSNKKTYYRILFFKNNSFQLNPPKKKYDEIINKTNDLVKNNKYEYINQIEFFQKIKIKEKPINISTDDYNIQNLNETYKNIATHPSYIISYFNPNYKDL